MPAKDFIKDYLTFTKKDKIGYLILLTLLVAVIFLPTLFHATSVAPQINTDTAWLQAMQKIIVVEDSLAEENTSAYQFETSVKTYTPALRGELFYFDPNTLGTPGWQRLGIKDKTIQTIQHYLSRGGRFKTAADLQKIYGLRTSDYERLFPYIRIAKQVSSNENTKVFADERSKIKLPPRSISIIDINTADSTEWIALPGIGSKLAARIVHFRDKLGGFYSIAQVGETYGVPDSTFQRIRPFLQESPNNITKININTAGVEELKTHPYIRWNIANAIIAFRNQHGAYTALTDLKRIMLIDEALYEKIIPYLSL